MVVRGLIERDPAGHLHLTEEGSAAVAAPRKASMSGFVPPCIRTRAPKPPSGPDWVPRDQAWRLPAHRPPGRRHGAPVHPLRL
jgi:hypothetical protein